MARKIVDLTDPKRPEYLKKSVALLMVRRQVADWIKENVSISRTVNRRILKAPIVDGNYMPETMPPNLDRRMGITFKDPAMRALAKTPQLNRIWVGEKVWLACD